MKGLSFKVIVIGDHSIGKTALIHKYIHGTFKDQFNVTVGAEFSSKTVEVDGHAIQLQIWDTSGQDVYHSVTSSFYRGAAAVFLIYAMNDRTTFEHLPRWLQDFYQRGSKEAFIFLVGTKADLEVAVTQDEAFEYMKTIQGAFFIETSAKAGDSVNVLFQRAAESMYKLYTISSPYRFLVDQDKLSRTKGSSINNSGINCSGISLQEMRRESLTFKRVDKKCC